MYYLGNTSILMIRKEILYLLYPRSLNFSPPFLSCSDICLLVEAVWSRLNEPGAGFTCFIRRPEQCICEWSFFLLKKTLGGQNVIYSARNESGSPYLTGIYTFSFYNFKKKYYNISYLSTKP